MIFFKRLTKESRRKKCKGFTLLEVMITTAVLALGAAMVYQSFFITLDSFNYYSTLLKVTPWMDEKIWEAQNEIAHNGSGAQISSGGKSRINNKEIDWGLSFNALDNTASLFAVELGASWTQGKRQIKVTRSAYAEYVKK